MRRILLHDGWDPKYLPDVFSRDSEKWQELGDSLEDLVLFDRDFEDEDIYVDLPPAASAQLQGMMRTGDDHFGAIAPEPTKRDIENVLD